MNLFGKRVKINSKLVRVYKSAYKSWKKNDFPETTGIIIGIRTLSDGTLHNYYSDGGIEYEPKKFFTAYLIAYHERRKPLLVLPDDVIFLENQ